MAEKKSYNRNDNDYNNDRHQNNKKYERREEKEEIKTETNESRNISVNLKTNLNRTESGIGDLDSKRLDIIADLSIVNNMLVDFYDSQLDEFGAQGLTDVQGRPYAAANYTTPEEKLSAIEGIIYYSKDKTHNFTQAFNRTQIVIKEKRDKLKQKAVKLLDDNKELINDNKKLINDAKLDIANNKEQSKKLELDILEEDNKAAAVLDKEKIVKDKVEALKEALEDLKTQQADINTQLQNAKDDEIEDRRAGNKKNNSQSGYYNAKGKELETINKEIQQKENFMIDLNNQMIEFRDEYNAALNKSKMLVKQKEQLDESITSKENDLLELENKNSELKQKFNSAIEPLENAFEENVKGMYKNDQRLNYEKESSLNTEDKENQEDVSTPETKEENKEQTQSNNGTIQQSTGLPADVTEEQLANNFINNFTHNTSAAQRLQIINGPGFANIIAAMDGSSRSEKRKLRDALLDMQCDLEEEIPEKDEFISNLEKILPSSEFDLEELYDSLFKEDKYNELKMNKFSKLEREQLREMQKALNKFEKLKTEGNLTIEQAQIFEKNFAKYAKMGSLLESSEGNSFTRGFKRIFGGEMFNIRRKFLNSLSSYTESRFTELNDQYSKHNNFLNQLGRNVESTPKYVENRGDISRTGRGLSKQVEDGKMNYR